MHSCITTFFCFFLGECITSTCIWNAYAACSSVQHCRRACDALHSSSLLYGVYPICCIILYYSVYILPHVPHTKHLRRGSTSFITLYSIAKNGCAAWFTARKWERALAHACSFLWMDLRYGRTRITVDHLDIYKRTLWRQAKTPQRYPEVTAHALRSPAPPDVSRLFACENDWGHYRELANAQKHLARADVTPTRWHPVRLRTDVHTFCEEEPKRGYIVFVRVLLAVQDDT